MAERPLYTLYKNLKAQNYDVPDDYNKFESALTRDGKGGADNRHAIYENLKAQNFDVPNTYERFYSALFEPRSKTSSRAKGGSVPMSAADRARFSAGAAAISASAQHTMNNAGRYNRLKQRKQKQQKDFGRVNLGTHQTPYGGDANNVVKDDFSYNPETGKAGAYVTSDNENAYTQNDAEQKQNLLDKYGEEWNNAVDMGIVPSELDKADPDLSDTDIAKRQMERRQEWLNENQNRRSKELNESMHLQGSPFVASGGAVAPSSFNTAISNEANRLSDVEYGAYNTAKAYNQMLRTTLLQELKEQKQRNENAGWWKDKWYDVSNYFGAMFNTLLDPKLYSQGVMDAAISNNLIQVKKGMEDGTIKKGSNAGNAAQAMLGAIQQQQGEAAKQQQYGTKAYLYGDMSGRSLKFMGDFALSGWRNVMTTGFTKAGEKVGEKMALGALGKWFTKNTGRVLGDIAGSAALAATNQLGSTYNNVIERYVGMNNENGGVTQGKNGDLKFNEGVSLGKAIKDGFGSATIENFSEMFGEYLPGAPKLLSKLGLSKVSSFFEKIGNNAYYKWLSNATNKSGIQGVMVEISEEEFGTALHAAWGDGDGSWSDFNVFTNPDAREKQIDTCLGMFYSVGFMQAPRTAVGAINAVQYFNIKHQVAKADKFGQVMFNDKWEEIKSKIDVTTNADLTKTVLDATRSDSMTAKQKGAVINYAMFLSKLRGFNQAADAKTKDKVEEGDTAPTLSNELDDAYTEGHNADDADKHNIQLEQNDKANELAVMLHITPEQLHDMADEDLEAMTGQDDKLDKAIYDYQVSTAKYQGVMDGAQDEVDMAAHQAAMETDNMTDLSRGTVRKATIKATGGAEDYEVYIISGNIATHDDGSIDVGNSDDMIIYYDPTTGRKEHADAMMFADLIEELPAADVKTQAINDAKENAIKKIAGIVDGTVDVGSQFSVTDADGTEHTYEVLADNGDGTAMITIDGNVPTELVKGENVQIPYSFADLQQMKDAEDLKRLEAAKAQREQMEKERAAQQTEQTQETELPEETQPSLDFNQILNDNGNVVLVDVLDKDGNTKYPDSKLFLIRDAGAKAKVVEMKSDGTFVPHAVSKKNVATISSMSLDEYKQAMAETSMIEENSGAIEGDRGGIEVNDELPPVPDNVTINGDGTYSVDGAVQGGENTTAPAEQTEQTPAMTLEDGTIVPMLEDGNPDFSKLTADQTAELYDSQFGEDADSVISGWVSDDKKALDKANNMTVKGKNFVEQKAAKEAKEKAIADAQAAYDSAIAIRDAYNSRQLAKVEDDADGRKNLIEKARRKFSRLKSAVKDDAEAVSQLYKDVVGSLLHRLYDGTGIDVTDTIPLTAEEYVASNLGAHSLNYEGTETSKGVKQETGLSREDFAKTQLLAADGKGTTIDNLVHSLWENRPSNLESLDTQDIRNALIGLLNSGFKASEARNYIENLRIAQAENILEEQKKAADNAAFAEEQTAPAEEQNETALESEEKTGEDNSDEINDEENEQTNAPEQNKFPDKLREGSKAIEVPEDATDEKPLGEQRTKSPFLVRENGKQQTETESDADVEKNKVDDMKVVDNIVGEKTRKTLEKIAKIMGANIQWLYSNKQFNGRFDEKTNTIYLTLDSSITEGVQFIFGHEMTHEMRTKNPAAYGELKTLVKDMMGEDAFNSETDKIQIRYKKGGARYWNDRKAIEEEVVADQLGIWIRDANYAHTLLLKMSHPLLARLHEIVNSFLMALHGTEFSDDMRLILRSIEQAYVKTAKGEITNTETGEDVSFSLRQKPEPTKKGIGYKVFVLKDGKLYPPMVANPDGAATPVGVWLDADAAPIAGESKTGRPQVKQGGKGTQGGSGKLAYRPGWHLGVVPYAIQFNRKDAEGNKTLFPKNFVFAEVEYAADVDYQEEARQEGINPSGKYQHSLAGLKHLPTDGYYMYRTNPNPETDPWVITGAMKVNRILTRAEQADLVSKAGREPQQIQEGDIVTDDVVNSINQEIADAPKFSLKKDGMRSLLDVDGKPVVVREENGNVDLNYRTWQDEKELVRDALVTDAGLEEDEADAMIAQADVVADAMKSYMDKYPRFRDYQYAPAGNREIIRDNGDYLSWDYSFNCIKKDAMNAVMDKLVSLGKSSHLGVTQVEAIKKILQKHKFLTPCVMCYVEGKRKVLKQSKADAQKWNSVREYAGLENKEMGEPTELTDEQQTALKNLSNGKAHIDGIDDYSVQKIANLMLDNDILRGNLNYEWMMSPSSFTQMYNKFGNTDLMKYMTLGQYRGKQLLEATPFSINNIPRELYLKMYSALELKERGGLRQFSYEDARAMMFFDYYTQFLLMQGARSPEHLYTKRPFMPEMFGKTGAMINQSLIVDVWGGDKWHQDALGLSDSEYDSWLRENAGFIPRGALPADNADYKEGSTELVPAWSVESFPLDKAMENIHNRDFKGNVGNTIVAPSHKFIQWALDNPDIHMILAYHAAGGSPIMKSLSGYDKATAMDGGYHTLGTDGKAIKTIEDKLTGVEISGGALQWNRLLRKNGYDAKKAAQTYLDFCKENGFTPMFNYEGVVDHPNYYKMLTDFRVYDEDGKSIRQKGVKAVLPDNWQEILNKYLEQEQTSSEQVSKVTLDENIMKEIDAATKFTSIELEERDSIMSLLQKIYGKGNVEVLGQNEFDVSLDGATSDGRAQMLRDMGGMVYGYATGNRIVLNEYVFNANTPLHEHAHLYMKVLSAFNPRLYQRGMELWRDTPQWNDAKSDIERLGEEPIDDRVFSECMAQFTGTANEDIISKVTGVTDKNWIQKALEWMKEMWDGVKSAFKRWTKGDLDALTADDFAHLPLRAFYDTEERNAYIKNVKALNDAGGFDGSIRFSLAGERGAAAADKAEERTFRMDNLSVAKDMEKNKKKAKAIKAATGWERGADGKWRYEMPDVVLRDPKEWVNKKNLTLSDIVEKPNDLFKEYPELFDAYPELKDMKILKGRARSGGVFYNNAITLNLGDIREAIKYDMDTHYKLANNSLKKTLVHEIQHYIQDKEGFAQGGNSEMIIDKNALDAIAKLRADKDAVAKEFYAMSPEEQQRRKYEINNRYNDLTKQIERLEKSSRIGYDGYKRLSGEVEARNVSARLNMTPEERRKSLAESTEDVARKDQIFLGVGDVSFSLRDMADGKESGAADMAEDLKSLNTPGEVDDAIKTAIDDMPSGWRMANRKMIHVAQALGENRKAEIAGEEPKFSLKDGSLIKGNTRFSLRYDKFEHDLNQWKKDNNLPKDAQRPTIPQRNAGESAIDFLRRVDEYRKQMALWKTAPTYEQHLLSDDTALGEFNRELQRGSVLKRIAFQDSMLAIRKAQEAIMKEVGVNRLNMAEDAYTAENRSHGKGKNEFEEYNNEFLQPLRKAYHQMKKVLGDSYDNVRVYMMAKHGLERDAQMAFKKSLEADYEDVNQRSAAYKAYKNDLDRVTNDADLEFGRVDFTTWRQKDNALRGKYSPSYMDYRYDDNGIAYDYSGLSSLFDGSDFEEAAHKLVRDVETKHLAEVQALWNATNAATKKILRDGFKAGMMSKDAYEYVKGMYSHYIPLRGWDGTTADQVWDYIGSGKGAFNQTLKTAHGRTSIADDPIAYIENMAESGILLNNKNWVKQHLMLLAQNHPTSLLTLSKAWYVKSTDANGNEEWIPATPQITSQMNSNQVKAAIDAFEQKMEQLAQTGDATQQRDGLNIAYPQTHSEEREHEVRVMKDGEEYVIYVNGDPQLAQAMNNTRAHRVREIQSGKLDRAAAWLGRKMAAAYTSLSPLFIPSNYFRDLTMTLASTAIREDGRYNYLLRKNLATSWNLGFMLRDYQNGKLREKVSNGNATAKEQMFYDFMMNGGETGFVSSLDVEDLKKKFKNDLKDLDRWKANPVKVGHTIMDGIEFLNRAIEDSNRFAVYMTSIQYGRSIDEAVNDAKNVTLNFNRKGTGEYGWQMIRNLYLFINPAVQSLQTLGALTKHHPFKFTAVTAAWLASGVLVPIVNAALMSLLGGDDDKDKYWQFSKWDRRNNAIMWIPFTNEYVKIPLAQEFRAFYGIGDMIASKMMGGELAEETWSQYAEDLLGQVVDMLPLDPTGYDGNIAVSLMPNAIRPVFELAFNVDFTGKPLFKDTEYNKYDPNFTKAYVGTPDWLVRVSKMVNSIGNDYPDVQQNAIDAFGDPRYNLNNPAVVDHVLSSYLGGAYTMGSQVLGLLTKSLNDPKEIKMADIPLLSKFVSNPDDRPVTKKQGDEFWNMKENHDRAANTLSKLKKQAKVDGDYSMLERFYGSEEYKQYKQEDVKVKKYEEDKKKERAEESGEEYRPHKLNAEDIYKAHATPKDDFEDLKLKQLYTKLNGFKTSYDLLLDTAPSQSDGYYNTNKAAIDAIDEISLDKQEISELKKGFLEDGKDAYNADDMKRIRELRKRILSVLEPANKVVVANQKAKAEKK